MTILRGKGRGSQSVMEACPPENASTAGKAPSKELIKDAGPATKAPYGNANSGVVKDYM
jgi:hypothetical protein